MTKRIWDDFLTEQDKAVFAQSGMGQRQGFGARPAVLVVDVNYNFTGDKNEPILDCIKRWPLACGHLSWPAIELIRKLTEAARPRGIPVIYTTAEYREDQADVASWATKNARIGEDNASFIQGNEIVREIAPQPQDIIIKKQKASAFHGTPIVDYLIRDGIDTLLVTGVSTSGCVRAAVVDAVSYNLRVTVVEDGCFDRSQASHAMSLCDMHMKYADVLPGDDVLKYIESFRTNLRASA